MKHDDLRVRWHDCVWWEMRWWRRAMRRTTCTDSWCLTRQIAAASSCGIDALRGYETMRTCEYTIRLSHSSDTRLSGSVTCRQEHVTGHDSRGRVAVWPYSDGKTNRDVVAAQAGRKGSAAAGAPCSHMLCQHTLHARAGSRLYAHVPHVDHQHILDPSPP
jgi:hypothetical protein